ncbi:glycosyltransferase family 2 protein [Pedobacter cryophilus]|uniref:Glycosyltransferase n=1 Tax=Pedobacter cryophilus TaxID=2571271 RepID=A0A4U1C0Q5_9SPHI|nr:glycosyltransferase family 2 protein [Pedobacter cryophilus]TKB98625.1 glycosyltransferase [Pedobacter cryophilus]
MDKVFFTIIIPTFNSSNTLKECLDSVFFQTFTNYEILIIDGLSTDKTILIANSYNDKRVKIISETDNGVYDAMNKGIELSQGDWLYFLGSDDSLYNSDVLGKIHKLCLLHPNNWIYGNVSINGNIPWAINKSVYDGEFNLQKIIERNICHQSVFYSKSLLTSIGNYNLKFKICADYDLNLRAYSFKKPIYINEILAEFNNGGISSYEKDEIFQNEYYSNLFKYFRNILYKSAFINIKEELRKYIFTKELHVCNKVKLYIFYFILSLKQKIKMHSFKRIAT